MNNDRGTPDNSTAGPQDHSAIAARTSESGTELYSSEGVRLIGTRRWVSQKGANSARKAVV